MSFDSESSLVTYIYGSEISDNKHPKWHYPSIKGIGLRHSILQGSGIEKNNSSWKSSWRLFSRSCTISVDKVAEWKASAVSTWWIWRIFNLEWYIPDVFVGTHRDKTVNESDGFGWRWHHVSLINGAGHKWKISEKNCDTSSKIRYTISKYMYIFYT